MEQETSARASAKGTDLVDAPSEAAERLAKLFEIMLEDSMGCVDVPQFLNDAKKPIIKRFGGTDYELAMRHLTRRVCASYLEYQAARMVSNHGLVSKALPVA